VPGQCVHVVLHSFGFVLQELLHGSGEVCIGQPVCRPGGGGRKPRVIWHLPCAPGSKCCRWRRLFLCLTCRWRSRTWARLVCAC